MALHKVWRHNEPLIDKATFDEVQRILDGKKKDTPKLHKPVNPDLFLRRFLTCPVCGHVLTGATSRGNGGLYNYYLCSHDHKHLNARAEDVNEGFVKYVSRLKPNKAILQLYNEILLDIRGDMASDQWFMIVGLGFLMGFLVASAEPAVSILGDQVEESSGGVLSKKLIIMILTTCEVAFFEK